MSYMYGVYCCECECLVAYTSHPTGYILCPSCNQQRDEDNERSLDNELGDE